MRERVLVLGHGAREHALAFKLAKGSSNKQPRREVLLAGGNAGIAQEFECINLVNQDHKEIVAICRRFDPHLIVIGPESYLASGIVDDLQSQGFSAFGPDKHGTRLESSKSFTKAVCQRARVSTAAHQVVNNLSAALSIVERYPHNELVIKVDGLCAGKGVFVCSQKTEAAEVLRYLFDGGFSRLGVRDQTVVIEEYLCGKEVSVFGAAYGSDVVLFNPMQDYKRLYDADLGPNTGGMGSVGPLGHDGNERYHFLEKVKEQIFMPVLWAMAKQGTPFFGLLYAGLMLTKEGIRLLEFNARFGDPETQALLLGTQADIYPLLKSIADRETIDNAFWQSELLPMKPTVAIVVASKNYPEKGLTNEHLSLPENLPADTQLFYAAVNKSSEGNLMACSGRVLSAVASGPSVNDARAAAYALVGNLQFSGMHYRRDIGTNLTTLNG